MEDRIGWTIPKRQRLPDQIASQLTEMIVTGVLPPGSALPPEMALAEKLMVSRPVVREALRILHSRGMISVRQGVGGFVNPSDQWKLTEPLALLVRTDPNGLVEWLEVRQTLEVAAVGLAAERAEADELQSLEIPLECMEREGSGNPEAYAAADVAFHLHIAAASHNRALLTLMRPILQPLHGRIMAVLQWPSSADWSNRQHRRIHRALLARDAVPARKAMEEHLAHVAEEVRRLGSTGATVHGSSE